MYARATIPDHLSTAIYPERDSALYAWRQDLPPDVSEPTTSSHQKIWDKPRVESLFNSLLAACSEEEGKARFLAASSRESGAWLNAPPISFLGLRMSKNTIQVATALRVAAPICQPHTCTHCGKHVDCFARHMASVVGSAKVGCRDTIPSITSYTTPSKLLRFPKDWNHLVFVALTGTDQMALPWSLAIGPRASTLSGMPLVDTYCQSHQHRASHASPRGCSNSCRSRWKRQGSMPTWTPCTSSNLSLSKPVVQWVPPRSASFLRELGKLTHEDGYWGTKIIHFPPSKDLSGHPCRWAMPPQCLGPSQLPLLMRTS